MRGGTDICIVNHPRKITWCERDRGDLESGTLVNCADAEGEFQRRKYHVAASAEWRQAPTATKRVARIFIVRVDGSSFYNIKPAIFETEDGVHDIDLRI